MITKLEISQRYNFSTLLYWSFFTIDFDKKTAFFNREIPIWREEFDPEFLGSISFEENFKLYWAFSKNITKNNYRLNDNQISDFLNRFNSLNLFGDYITKYDSKLDLENDLSRIEIKIHYSKHKRNLSS